MTTISFAITDFHNQVCKVLGIRKKEMFQFEYADSPAPFTKDTVLLFHAHVWPLIDHTNIGTVQFTFVLPDTSEKTGVLENFSVDCILKHHEEKVARGGGHHLAQFSVKFESE